MTATTTLRRLGALGAVGALALLGMPAVHAADSGTEQSYLVVYQAQSLSPNATATITSAGGTVLASYPQIGVVVARSASATFGDTLMANGQIQGVAATAGFATRVVDDVPSGAADDSTPVGPAPAAPTSDSLAGLQWDMDQIHAPEAHAINGGSPSVTVGDIDTGI